MQQAKPQPRRLLTAEQVGEMLQLPTSWVHAEARAMRIPYISLGRYRRFDEHAIEAWWRRRREGPWPQEEREA